VTAAGVRFGVVTYPGSNCDRDCCHVIENVLGQAVDLVWHRSEDIDGYDCLVLPGGFAHGDYLRAGAIARFSPVTRALERFVSRGGLVLGICNGFHVLLEAGLLPGAMKKNECLHFICEHVYVRVENASTPFTRLCRPGQVLKIPIAHYEGNYYADDETLRALDRDGRVAFRYCTASGDVTQCANPNGSAGNVAGIVGAGGAVLGLMPHPERAAEDELGSADGRLIFESIVHFVKERRSNEAARTGGGPS